jgi:hypothetical protein
MIFYKYRNNSEYTDKIFIDKKIWLSNAEGLNDPFECTISEIANDWIEAEVKKMKGAQLSGFVFGAIQSISNKSLFYNLAPKQTKEFLGKFSQKSFDSQYRTYREFVKRKLGIEPSDPEETFKNFDKQLSSAGIFSLSESDDNELMWAHYADSSKGIALGFERVKGSKLDNEENFIRVNYTNKRPTFGGEGFKVKIFMVSQGKNLQQISFNDDTFRNAISTKTTIWDYEKEWRYIEEKSGSYPYPGKLKEVIFGLKCPQSIRAHYVELIKNTFQYEVELYEMVVAPGIAKLVKRNFLKL